MPATLTYRGRLPGVDVNPALPPVEEPVRLDVAAFVGFAERGPVDTPVAIEDPTQYGAVFGGDLALAQDGGAPVYAQLPNAVKAFFDNGGRRCYVVRVAGPHARSTRGPVPGLKLIRPGTDASTPAASLGDAFVAAAWPGAWARGLSVETVLDAQQLTPAGDAEYAIDGTRGTLQLDLRSIPGIVAGDLIRLELDVPNLGLFTRVAGVDPFSGAVVTDVQLPFTPGEPDTPAELALDALPRPLHAISARLVRFELIAQRRSVSQAPEIERWSSLAFCLPANGLGTSWLDALQSAGAPDLSRSLLLRQDDLTTHAIAGGAIAVPMGMGLPDAAQSPAPADQPTSEDELGRGGDDDLGTFSTDVFVDPNLAGCSVYSLVSEADLLTSLAADPIALRGIHSLIGIDEVALVAVPDAGNRGWAPAPPVEEPPNPPPEAYLPPPSKDWSTFTCCDDQGCECDDQSCDCKDTRPAPVAAPALPPVTVTPTLLPQLDPLEWYDETGLVDVQVALVTMCAARADQFGLLSVPQHYDTAATLAWRERLRSIAAIADGTSSATPPLGYAGLWHPWVSVAAGTTDGVAVLRDITPDGVAAGCVAAREIARGAWIAPAGTALVGLLRTVPELTRREQVQLFNAHANLIAHPPGRFTPLSAHTLTDEPSLLQVSVRRLLILVRKTALRFGRQYVFEVDNDIFRQLVRMTFDRILLELQNGGALAGFNVVVGDDPQDLDNGRLIVQLQLAPTSPVEFITVTLSRTGEGLLDVWEG